MNIMDIDSLFDKEQTMSKETIDTLNQRIKDIKDGKIKIVFIGESEQIESKYLSKNKSF